ncbi:MAG TPA: ABC transporter permease, partial [Candidatus Krumholzibacterium sp.]|nr:ABC transporter permease [Candidatus Krumholzibacterium sp.]
MLKHAFLLFIRSFRKNIVINTLNLLGLAAGLAACMMIIIYLVHENSYDDFHENADRIARVNTDLKVGEGQSMHLPTASYPVSAGLASEISGIENYVRFRYSSNERPVYVGEKVFLESHIAWVDSTIFDIFSYPLLQGDPKTALAAPQSVVISRSTATKFFGDENPIGKSLSFDRAKEYTITAVMEDIPQPSHMPSFPMLMSVTSIPVDGADYWVGRSFWGSYVLLEEGQTAGLLQPSVDRVFTERASELLEMLGAESSVSLQPIKEIHFDDSFDFPFDFAPAVTREKLTVFALIALFILVISTVSFINLATARSGERARQVGIAKAVGASRRSLAGQFIGEFVATALIALAIAFLIVEMMLSRFSEYVGSSLSTSYLSEPALPLAFVALAVLVGILSGAYPAIFLSSFKPVDTIRSSRMSLRGRSRMRRVLIVFQFTISILLVICTLTVSHQLGFIDGRYPGFDGEQLLVVSTAMDMSREDCELLRQQALTHPAVLNGTLATYLPTMGHMENTYDVPEPVNCDMLMTRQFLVDEHYIETLGMELVAGRGFDEQSAELVGTTVIINETAVRTLGYDDAVGKLLDANPAKGEDNYSPVTIIGVVKDINFESLHHEIEPMLLIQSGSRPARICFRVHPGDIPGAISHIEGIWAENFPRSPFRYEFLDDTFNDMYSAEIRLGRLFSFYTVLA